MKRKLEEHSSVWVGASLQKQYPLYYQRVPAAWQQVLSAEATACQDPGPCPTALVDHVLYDMLQGLQRGDLRLQLTPVTAEWSDTPEACDADHLQRGQELTRNGLLLALLPLPLRLTLETPAGQEDLIHGRPTFYFAQADYAGLLKALRPCEPE